jgi:cytidylate kinase
MHQITIWMPQSFYAKVVRIARQRDVSVQRVLRMTLMRHLPTS